MLDDSKGFNRPILVLVKPADVEGEEAVRKLETDINARKTKRKRSTLATPATSRYIAG